MFQKLFASQLRINMLSGVAATVVNAVVLAIAYPVYLHFLGYEQYGVWLVLSTVVSFAQLGNLGVSQAVMKLVAEEHGRNNLEAVQQYVTSAVAILVVSGVVVLGLVVLLRTQIVLLFRLSPKNAAIALRLLPYVAGLSVYVLIVQAVNATLSGLGRMDLANYVQTAGRVVAVSVAAALLLAGHGVSSLLLGNTLSYAFVHAVSLLLIRRVLPLRLIRTEGLSVQRVRRLLRFGAGVFGGSVLSMLLAPFNRLMLSRYAGVASIPVYEIAFSGSMQVRALIEAGLRALTPEVSRIGANMTDRTRTRIQRINRRATTLIYCLGLPLYGALIVSSPLLLRVWLGSQVVEGLPAALRIALLGSLSSLACVPAYYVLLGLGHVRHCLIGHALLSGGNVLLVLLLAWTDDGLSVSRLLVAGLIATMASSMYLIVQNARVLRRGVVGPAEVQEYKPLQTTIAQYV